jgi:hypothetical protein
MRQITRDATNAFYNGSPFKRDNTEITLYGTVIQLELHRHNIATYYTLENKIQISSCGWYTTTTKERLNGVLARLNMHIKQTKGVWRVYDSRGDSVPFKDGMTIKL